MIIYKYLDEYGALETIKNNSVILQNPSEYNDPFDCDVYTTEEESEKAFQLFVNYQAFMCFYDGLIRENKKPEKLKLFGAVTKKNLQCSASQIKKTKLFSIQPYLLPFHPLLYKTLKKSKAELKKEFKQMIKNVFKNIKNSILASCFGSSYDSILMWSHYGDKHRGACIEFEIENNDFRKVTYDKDMKPFELTKALQIIFGHEFAGEEADYNDEKYYFLCDPLLTKAIGWEYEGEVRCLYSANKPNPKIRDGETKEKKKIKLLFDTLKAKKVYLGCNASKEFIKDVKDCSGDIPIMKMKKLEGKYCLIAEPLD